MKKRTCVIAEAGSNHNRSLKTALDLIDAAAHSHCDIIKFQTFSSATLYARNTADFGGFSDINRLIESIELPRNWHIMLKTACDDAGIEFLSTPFDERAIDELMSVGVKRIKIAGFEALDERFVRLAASTKLPVIFSAGIGSSKATVLMTIEWIRDSGNMEQITVLHCNHSYPTPIIDANLGTISVLRELSCNGMFDVGYSDHTTGTFAPVVAVALGATVVEKHFTLDKNANGPDHAFAIEPNELYSMVEDIRRTELSLSVRESAMTRSEKMFSSAMRSVVSLCDIEKDELFTEQNITTSRPFIDGAVHANMFYKLIDGKARTARAVQKRSVITVDNIRKN